jgi:hypothetical protein
MRYRMVETRVPASEEMAEIAEKWSSYRLSGNVGG